MFKCAGPYTSLSIFYRVWKNKLRAMESTRMKLEASEEKCSWSDDVIRNKFIRSISLEAISSEAEVHQKMRDLKLQRLFNGLITSSIAEDWKNKVTANSNKFEGIGRFYFGESWQRTIVRTVQLLSPLLYLCLCIKTRITAMPAAMFLQTRNAFEIDPS